MGTTNKNSIVVVDEFVFTHDFEASPWHHDATCTMFKVGTCFGLYTSDKRNYILIAVDNDEKRNGCFNETLEYFYRSCRRDKKNLVIAAILNEGFYVHLMTKRGFKEMKGTDLYKPYFEM